MRVNEDNLEIAKKLLVNGVKIPDYFKAVVCSGEDIESKALVCCPLHDEITASFKYFKDTESFYCFGCEKGGSIVELHYYFMQRENPGYSKIEAVLDLGRMFSVKIPDLFIRGTSNEFFGIKEYKKPVVAEKREYTDKWLLSQIEKGLKSLKGKNIDKYIEVCNLVDMVCLIDVDKNKRLEEILEGLRLGG